MSTDHPILTPEIVEAAAKAIGDQLRSETNWNGDDKAFLGDSRAALLAALPLIGERLAAAVGVNCEIDEDQWSVQVPELIRALTSTERE